MPNWTGGIITARGRELQAKVEAGETLVITKMKLGSGTPQAYEMDTLTDLKQPLMEFGISSKTVENNICEVTGVVVSSEIETPFYAREWGLFAQDPDEGEILYMYTTDPNPDFIPAKTAALQISATYALNIVVLNVDNIVVNIDPNGLVTTAILKNELKKYLPLSGGDMTGDITANNVYANNNILVFNNVAEMKASNKVKAGYTLKTLGFYEPNDGGGADYIIDDIGEDEIDETSIIELQNNLYAKLIIQDYVNIKWFGVKLDGVFDDSTNFNKAVEYLNNKAVQKKYDTGWGDENTRYTLVIPKGIMVINSFINFNVSTVRYKFLDTIIDAKNVTDTAIKIVSNNIYQGRELSSYKNEISGFSIYGDKDNKIATAIEFVSLNGEIPARLSFKNILIEHFLEGVQYCNHSYMDKWIKVSFINCTTAINMDKTYNDSGENSAFISCLFANCDLPICNSNSASDFYFINCSFDFNKQLIKATNNSCNYFNNCHIEWEDNGKYLIDISKGNTFVSIAESKMLDSANEEYSDIAFNVTDDVITGGIYIKNTLMHNIKSNYLCTQNCFLDNIYSYKYGTLPRIQNKNFNFLSSVSTLPENIVSTSPSNISFEDGVITITANINQELYIVVPVNNNNTFYCTYSCSSNVVLSQPLYVNVGYYAKKANDNSFYSVYNQGDYSIRDRLNGKINEYTTITDSIYAIANRKNYPCNLYVGIKINFNSLASGTTLKIKDLYFGRY